MEARTLPNRAQRAPRGGQDAQKTEKKDRPNIKYPRRVRGPHFLIQNVGTANEPWVVYVGSIFFFNFLGVLAPSWRPLGSIWEGSGLHFGGFWCPFSSQFPSFLIQATRQPEYQTSRQAGMQTTRQPGHQATRHNPTRRPRLDS